MEETEKIDHLISKDCEDYCSIEEGIQKLLNEDILSEDLICLIRIRLIEAYNLGKEEGEKKEGWVSVKDQLPEQIKPVLLCTEKYCYLGYLDKRGIFCEESEGYELDIDYWRYLPETPDEILKENKQ